MFYEPLETLGTAPPDEALSLVDQKTQRPVEGHLERVGAARVDFVPASPLLPNTEYEAIWQLQPSYPIVVSRFTTDSSRDDQPPALVRVGPPQPRSVGSPPPPCSLLAWTEIPVVVTDASPVVIAVWTGSSAIDLSTPPTEYAWPEAGKIRVRPRARGDSAQYAVMAIDAAGNRSDVVFTPGGKRVSAVAIGSSVLGPSVTSDASATTDTGVESLPATTAPPSPVPSARAPTTPPRGGCAGCNATGDSGPAGASGPFCSLGAALAALSLVTWLRRPKRPPTERD